MKNFLVYGLIICGFLSVLCGSELSNGRIRLVLRDNDIAPKELHYEGAGRLIRSFFYSWYAHGQWYSDRTGVRNIADRSGINAVRILKKTADQLKVVYVCRDFKVEAEYALLSDPDAVKAEFYLTARQDIFLGGIDPPGGFTLPLIGREKRLNHYYQADSDLVLKLMSKKDFPDKLTGIALDNCIAGVTDPEGKTGFFILIDRRFYTGTEPPYITPGGLCFSKEVCRLIKKGEVIKGQFYLVPFKDNAAVAAKAAVEKFCDPDPARRWDRLSSYRQLVKKPLSGFVRVAENAYFTAASGSTEQVFPQSPLPEKTSPTIHLESAGNQSVFAQIMLKPKKDLKNLHFKLDFPSVKDIRINHIAMAPSDYPATSFAAAGDFPDILAPAELTDLKAGDGNAAWLISLFVPENMPAGLYQGSVSVLSDGQVLDKLKLELKVYPFSLPRRSRFRTAFLLWTSKPYAGEFNLQSHLLDQRKLRITTPVEIATPCGRRGDLRSPDSFRRAVREALAAGDTCFRLSGAYMWRCMPVKDKTSKDAELFIKNYVRQVHGILKELDAVKMVWFLMADETHRPKLNTMHAQWGRWVKEAAPELPLFSTQNHPEFNIAEQTDILCGPSSSVEVLRRKFGNKKEYWLYENGFPFSLGQSEIVTRSMPLRCWRGGIAGYHQWSSCFWTPEPRTGRFRNGNFHGTASLYYPPEFGDSRKQPVRSMRLVNCSQGIVDHDYVMMLRDKIAARPNVPESREAEKFLNEMLNRLVPDLYTIRGTTKDFEQFRKGIAERIIKLSDVRITAGKWQDGAISRQFGLFRRFGHSAKAGFMTREDWIIVLLRSRVMPCSARPCPAGASPKADPFPLFLFAEFTPHCSLVRNSAASPKLATCHF